MHKIYSRFRFRIPKLNKSNLSFRKKVNKKNSNKLQSNNIRKKSKKKQKIGKIIAILGVAILTANAIYNHLNPVFIGICEGKVKRLATIVSNEQATKAIQNYTYEDLFEVEKDNNGKVIMIKSNVITINDIISNIAIYIQNELNKEDKANIEIPIGSLLGSNIFSGYGPNIKGKVIYDGIVDTDLKSEFTSKGINQTMHRIYLQVDCKVTIITPFEKIGCNVSNQVLLMENVILGEIPNTYYNLEGITNPVDIVE